MDGIFGEATRDQVYAVQRTFDLPVDGLVGEQTWNAITDAYYGIINRIPVTLTDGNIVPFQGRILRESDESEEVRILQTYLDYIAQSIPEVPAVTPTGYFGPLTKESVEAFQKLYGMPVTGYVNALTWSAIADLYSDLYIGNRRISGQYPGYDVGT